MSDSNRATSPAQAPRHTNRLAQETSPYLLQHQHNPVDWYAWGPEAFEAARAQDKPIFLSVGYSTCYWCHVMERQCFEVDAVAAVMNESCINIKVDREERPDVDQLYMTAVQVLTRHGGWPMSVFLTPDLRPFYGGTYFPPEDAHGRPGFVTVLRGIADAHRNRKDDVEKSANQLVTILNRLAEPNVPDEPIAIDHALIDSLVVRSTDDYESTFGGFGRAPKFPRETLLELLLVYLNDPRDPGGADAAAGPETGISKLKVQIRVQLLHTLDALAHGGIRDHLGGGFHRYSTDEKWLVPHFEIMLYDNAMLAWCYVEAFRQTGDARYAQVARDVFEFVLREMTSPAGPFYTALDAEVDGQEGLNYLWTKEQVNAALTADEARRFNRVYGLDRGFNFADPHHGTGRPDKNILYLAVPGEGAQSALLDADLRAMRKKLYDVRQARKQPLLDTKILTSWNALMIRAFAYGGQVLAEPRYVEAGTKAAEFLLAHHRKPDGGLYRTSRDTPAKYDAFLDDYAFLSQALLALERAGAGLRWKALAAELSIAMYNRFADHEAGGFYFSAADARDLIIRQKTAADSPHPSGNAVAAMVLLSLGQLEAARNVLAAFAEQVRASGEGMSSMVQAMLAYLRAGGEPFTVTGEPRDASGAIARPATPQQAAADVVAVAATWANPREMQVRLTIDGNYHINAHDVGEAGIPLIATRLDLSDDSDVAAIDYPPGAARQFAFAETPLRVYAGDVTIIVRFKSDRQGGAAFRARVTYQACDDAACLPPVTKGVEI